MASLNTGLDVKFQEAIDAALAKGVVLPEIFYGELQGISRQAAFSTAMLSSIDQLERVLQSLIEELENGASFTHWKENVVEPDLLILPDYRLETIFRTNIQQSYNVGRWTRFDAVKDIQPYLMYDAIDDVRVRESHLALDGVIRATDDPFWDTYAPSNGFNCRCRLISLSPEQAENRGGITKQVSNDVQPDKGWDYNPGKDTGEGLETSFDNKPEGEIKSAAETRFNETTQ